jgi:hypothetical protein
VAWSVSYPYINHPLPNTHHFIPDVGGSMFRWNVGTQLKYYTAWQLRSPSIFILPWKPKVLQIKTHL